MARKCSIIQKSVLTLHALHAKLDYTMFCQCEFIAFISVTFCTLWNLRVILWLLLKCGIYTFPTSQLSVQRSWRRAYSSVSPYCGTIDSMALPRHTVTLRTNNPSIREVNSDCFFRNKLLTCTNVAIFWDVSSPSWWSTTHMFLTCLIFDPVDGGDTFLRNIGSQTDYTT
jgi:hypothetical protein